MTPDPISYILISSLVHSVVYSVQGDKTRRCVLITKNFRVEEYEFLLGILASSLVFMNQKSQFPLEVSKGICYHILFK